MKRIKNKSKIKIISTLLLGLLVLGFISTDVYAATSYQSNLVKGTEELMVTHYDYPLETNHLGLMRTPLSYSKNFHHNE
jgi:hypothetical protein